MSLDLTTLAIVKTYMGISDASKDALINLLIPAISQAIESYCNRKFELTNYGEFQWSEGGPILYLQNIPVVQVKRIVCDTDEAMDVRNRSSIATGATIELSKSQDKLFLNVFGDVGSQEIDIAAKTLQELKTAIEAVANWEVDLRTDGSRKASELFPVAGLEAFETSALLELFGEPIDDYLLTNESGRVERRYGNFPTQRLVFVEYRAGYADVDAIPKDLQLIATKMVANTVNFSEKDLSLKSESWPDYKYTIQDIAQLANDDPNVYETQLSFWRRIPL